MIDKIADSVAGALEASATGATVMTRLRRRGQPAELIDDSSRRARATSPSSTTTRSNGEVACRAARDRAGAQDHLQLSATGRFAGLRRAVPRRAS